MIPGYETDEIEMKTEPVRMNWTRCLCSCLTAYIHERRSFLIIENISLQYPTQTKQLSRPLYKWNEQSSKRKREKKYNNKNHESITSKIYPFPIPIEFAPTTPTIIIPHHASPTTRVLSRRIMYQAKIAPEGQQESAPRIPVLSTIVPCSPLPRQSVCLCLCCS